MLSVSMMKQILADKLKAENCYFTKKDIHIQKVHDSKYAIYIAGYEHIIFYLRLFFEDNEHIVFISNKDMRYNDESIMVESKNNYDYESALIELGYYIATRF